MTPKTIRLLLDENIGVITLTYLRNQGYDVISILEQHRGSKDADVLTIAYQEKRILVTLDRDFGYLVYQNSAKHVGVIYVRLSKESTETINQVLHKTLMEFSDQIDRKFVTVSETDIRIRD